MRGGRPLVLGMLACLLGASVVGAADAPLALPLGLDPADVVVSPDNPLTPEKIALGKQFFWDTRWSKNKTTACVTCHRPEHGWSDPRRFSLHDSGKLSPRHSQTVINRAFGQHQQWAGTRVSAEDQAAQSGDRHPEATWLADVPYYREQFRKVFGRDLDARGVALAISAYEMTIVSGNSPYDRYRAGDTKALSAAARRGLALFEGKARCAVCHNGSNLTDEGYHNIGIGATAATPDVGRYAVTKIAVNHAAFKTPTLRDVAQRGPYMHDGSLATLEQVVDYYNHGGTPNPSLSPEIRPLGLTAQERGDLVEFLQALTGYIAADVSTPPTFPQ